MNVLCELLPSLDCMSLKVNFLTSLIFLLFSLLLSIWLIPKITVRLINRANKDFNKLREAYILSELTEFLNKTPKQYLQTDKNSAIFIRGKNISIKFIGLIPTDLRTELGKAELTVKILQSGQGNTPVETLEVLNKENNKIKILESKLENILSTHHKNIDDLLANKIMSLCLSIKSHSKYCEMNKIYPSLNINPKGVFGIIELKSIYKEIIELFEFMMKAGKKYFFIENK